MLFHPARYVVSYTRHVQVWTYADMHGECNLYGHRGEEVIYLCSFAEKGETDGRRTIHLIRTPF